MVKLLSVGRLLESTQNWNSKRKFQFANCMSHCICTTFSVTGKFRYAESVAIFLEKLYKNTQLQKWLYQVPSINIICEEHYLAYDKVLKTYRVKIVKQVITRKSRDNENLHQQIKGSQDKI